MPKPELPVANLESKTMSIHDTVLWCK